MNCRNNRIYVHSKYVSKCVKIKDVFYIIHDEKLEEVVASEIDRNIFCQIPGTRLLESIENEGIISVTTNDLNKDNSSETYYFEEEKDSVYLLNLDRIVCIKMIYTDIWLVQMEDQVLWFKSFQSNFKHVISQLRK